MTNLKVLLIKWESIHLSCRKVAIFPQIFGKEMCNIGPEEGNETTVRSKGLKLLDKRAIKDSYGILQEGRVK